MWPVTGRSFQRSSGCRMLPFLQGESWGDGQNRGVAVRNQMSPGENAALGVAACLKSNGAVATRRGVTSSAGWCWSIWAFVAMAVTGCRGSAAIAMPSDAPEHLASVDVDPALTLGVIDVGEPGGHVGVPYDGEQFYTPVLVCHRAAPVQDRHPLTCRTVASRPACT